ncbi:MAG: Uncharacterized protein G01um101470_894 [Parcubacteria group bacterium Gr01-1014_70]|nr:MAG: Uncharacterized protein G01um101470_894 [Parcubacteria group bacterium Gr01-1014_70]
MVGVIKRFDWILLGCLVPLFVWSLLTLKATETSLANDYFFTRQLIWIAVGFLLMVCVSYLDWHVFSHSGVILVIYAVVMLLLIGLFVTGREIKGAISWFTFPVASFQPAEIAKVALILVLAKYFSRRHIDIARFRHLVISGIYTFVPVALILLQPDLGSAIIIVAVWMGITMVAGIRLHHFLIITAAGVGVAVAGWFFFLQPYQQQRILTFVNPGSDPMGTGYNALQSMIAVGSGEFFGKGVGYGSQSRLRFLPESETDFIFAAFAEEWGFAGVVLLFIVVGILLWRILAIGFASPSNFTRLFSVGFSLLLVVQIIIHAGMNMGLLPITGITFPFLSYGGSNLLTLFFGIGILQNVHFHRYLGHAADVAGIGDSLD